MTLLYVMHEHPSVSQSFVVNEAAAVERLGVSVTGYALKRGAAERPAAEIQLIEPPPSKLQLAMAGLVSLPSTMSVARRATGLPTLETARLVLAELHATHVLGSARMAGVSHVHAHFLGRTADVAAALAQRIGCAWSATAHGNDVYSPAEPDLLKRHLREVAMVACASEDVREHLNAHAASGTVVSKVVHCGIDTSALRFARSSPFPPHIVTVGRLVKTKGYLTAIKAAADLMAQDPALRWTIVGDGPLRGTLEAMVRERNLAPRLTLTGALDHQATLALLVEASLFVLPCEQGSGGESDGIPVALMEAMALGLPVVTTPIGGITELVVSEETGYLVPPRDPEALASTLLRILDPKHRDRLEQVRQSARNKVEREFDQLREARALIELLGPHLKKQCR